MDDQEKIDVAYRFVRAIETSDLDGLVLLCCKDVRQTEWPNRISDRGNVRDLSAMVDGFERGIKLLVRQNYEVKSTSMSTDGVALEMEWRGVLAVALGDLSAGEEMVAHIAMFLTFRDGKISTCHNYDCFEPF